MMLFWAAAAGMAAAASLLILWVSGRRTGGQGRPSPERSLYLRQLQELEEQRVRGVLDEAELKSARAEAARRLLDVSDETEPTLQPSRFGRLTLFAVVAATPLLALLVYAATGAAGRPDQPYAARLEAWSRADLTRLPPAALAAVAQSLTERRPQDAQAWRFLGRARLQAGDAFGAVQALERAARLGGTSEDWAVLGEALAVSGGGEVGRDAAAAFQQAVRVDPASVAGRYGLAQAMLARGEVEEARAALLALAQSLPPADERRRALQAEAAGLAADARR